VEVSAQREADRITRNRFAPPSVLVNSELMVLEFRGDTGPFLKPPVGPASFQLLKMARDGLTQPLRTAFSKARKSGASVRKENVKVRQNGDSFIAHLEVVPLKHVKDQAFL